MPSTQGPAPDKRKSGFVSEPSEKITKFLILFIIGVLIIKSMSGAGLFEPKDHKGNGYFVKVPSGWKIVQKKKGMIYPKDVEVVMLVPRDTSPDEQSPDPLITIFSKKLSTPIWIEDEFPDILDSILKEGMDIKDKGEIKIDDKITSWVIYHDKKKPSLVLEFYMVTDNSIFIKIQYAADPAKFNLHRQSFEELKDSFKFRFALY